MAIDSVRTLSGHLPRGPVSDGGRAAPRNAAPPVGDTEQPGQRPGEVAPVRPEPGAQQPVEETSLMRAVDEANALAEAQLTTRTRSVTFEQHTVSGRQVITIKEEAANGEVTTRQLPPDSFLRMLERLKEARGEGEEVRPGTLVDVSA